MRWDVYLLENHQSLITENMTISTRITPHPDQDLPCPNTYDSQSMQSICFWKGSLSIQSGLSWNHIKSFKNNSPATWTCLETLWFQQTSLHWRPNQWTFLAMASFESVLSEWLPCTHIKQGQIWWGLHPLPKEGVNKSSPTGNTPPPTSQDRKDLKASQINQSHIWIKLFCCST